MLSFHKNSVNVEFSIFVQVIMNKSLIEIEKTKYGETK